MDCNCNKDKRSYHFHICEVVEGKVQDVMSFNFGGHHDLKALADRAQKDFNMSEKHADQLVLGMRLLHHALKKYPDNAQFADFLTKLNDFKQYLKSK
ncbi:MAG: DUF3861 family protein [Bacteroides sp.]|nr:DUF3861 family protein [Bacteroides sp.]MCM1378873.1 DUF3861 family protein [Bacteroides sp.]MCM1445489.1 DUF3861 family protein [Prevotella sp.]